MEIYNEIKKDLAKFILLYVVTMIAMNELGIGFDDSDDYKNRKRSGLKVYTDYKTGIQYLGTSDGGLVRREYK